MAVIYYDPVFLEHDTGRGHPERPERLVAILDALGIDRADALPEATDGPHRFVAPTAATLDDVARLHPPRYVEVLRDAAARGGGWLDPDTAVSPRSVDAALLAAGAAVAAASAIVPDEDARRRAFALVRPPGHHARPAHGMGFCLLNNVAIAAASLLERHGLDRVAVVDFDVHHGNGTQEAFYDDPRVFYASLHRWPFYPGTGGADETGEGEGLGTTLNLPLHEGAAGGPFRAAVDRIVDALDRWRPQAVLISAGFDAHRADPIGGLAVEAEDYGHVTRRLVQLAETHAGGRIVSILEGGYDLDALGESVLAHLEALDGDGSAGGA